MSRAPLEAFGEAVWREALDWLYDEALVRPIDAYQILLQRALEVDGAAWVSVTTLRGRTYLRAGIVNYPSTEAEVDAMLDALRRLSEGVLEQLDAG